VGIRLVGIRVNLELALIQLQGYDKDSIIAHVSRAQTIIPLPITQYRITQPASAETVSTHATLHNSARWSVCVGFYFGGI